ncbi:MAG: hypothetical protein NWF05_06715 [Candidatus Bathyarchaeota archaeon]|nr:hypothetical protein [Candidatus Bathyarchaeota archaeon]
MKQKKRTAVIILAASLLLGMAASEAMISSFAYANPYDPTTGKINYPPYETFTVTSPQNTTHHINQVTFTLTTQTQFNINTNTPTQTPTQTATQTSTQTTTPRALEENTWKNKTLLPKTLTGGKAVTVNNKIYVFHKEATYMYNPQTDNWTQKTTMPTPRIDYAIAAIDNKVYVISGQKYWFIPATTIVNSEPSTVNEVYDAKADTWETKQALPKARRNIDANVANGKIYLISGEATEVYDPTTDSWTNKTKIPYWPAGYVSSAINDKIYIIAEGGRSVHIYDANNDSWSNGSPIPKELINLDVGAISMGIGATTGKYAPKRIYVIGGYIVHGLANYEAISQNWVYDPESDSWGTATDMPTARGHLAVAVVEDKLFAIGGGLTSFVLPGQATDTVEVYTPLGYGTMPPTLQVHSPINNQTYMTGNVTLKYTLNKPATTTYNLNGQQNQPLTGNTTLTNLTPGTHNLTIHATDNHNNTATSTVNFTITTPTTQTNNNPNRQTNTHWITTVAILVAAGVLSAALLKKKRGKGI